jgi:hypothetical protein
MTATAPIAESVLITYGSQTSSPGNILARSALSRVLPPEFKTGLTNSGTAMAVPQLQLALARSGRLSSG